jgi:hypothetical protein
MCFIELAPLLQDTSEGGQLCRRRRLRLGGHRHQVPIQ